MEARLDGAQRHLLCLGDGFERLPVELRENEGTALIIGQLRERELEPCAELGAASHRFRVELRRREPSVERNEGDG